MATQDKCRAEDGQENVGDVGQESKCTGLYKLVEYIGKS